LTTGRGRRIPVGYNSIAIAPNFRVGRETGDPRGPGEVHGVNRRDFLA
jgi:hypothetical protein